MASCSRPGGSNKPAELADLITAAIALGSNIGDRAGHLDHAVSRLNTLLTEVRVSRFRETAPVGVSGPQSLYLNGALVGRSAMAARDLLRSLQEIEAERGRERPYLNAPRTLDLDLILFGAEVIDEPSFVVPHPRFRERRFVLEPLAELLPDMRDPVTGLTVAGLLERLG
jgi:2-amino-4-hydroxy-6-hydroxymethyldihydropteridine diphosphokinase